MACARPALLALCAALALGGCAQEPKRVARPAPRPMPAAKPVAPAKPAATVPAAGKSAAPKAQAPAAPPARPLSPDERYAQALQQMKSNDLQGAEANLIASAQAFPSQTGPLTNLGIVYAKTNRKTEAAAEFNKATALSSKNAVAQNWLGVLARERGDYVRAEQSYKQALVADPSCADAQLNLAILYDQYLKRPADALTAYRRYNELSGKKDVRAAVWIAALQAQQPAPAAATPVKVPAPAPKALPGPKS